MTHVPHEPIETAGLDADCPRCQEIAADPINELDAVNLVRLISGHEYSDLDREAASRIDGIRRAFETLQRRTAG